MIAKKVNGNANYYDNDHPYINIHNIDKTVNNDNSTGYEKAD